MAKTKPIQTQFKPKQSQFDKLKNESFCVNKEYNDDI
jgi:hypothetical protein